MVPFKKPFKESYLGTWTLMGMSSEVDGEKFHRKSLDAGKGPASGWAGPMTAMPVDKYVRVCVCVCLYIYIYIHM